MTREEFLKTFPQLIKGYKPASKVLGHIDGVELLMLIGPSGVGKSTLINELSLPFVPSDTTRLQRPGETDGTDFFFRTDYDQLARDIKDGAFVQVAIGPAGDFYATRESAYPSSGMAVMPVVADVVPIFRGLGFKKTISAFIVPPSYEEWMRRMHQRPLSEEQLAGRLAEARRSLQFALSDSQTHLILNDDIEAALAQIDGLLEGRVDEAREKRARGIVQTLLDGIK